MYLDFVFLNLKIYYMRIENINILLLLIIYDHGVMHLI